MAGTKIRDVADFLGSFAPQSYQEAYDNSGLITGDFDAEVTGILVTLDSTEEVVDEAIARKCNLIVAHHPILFSAIKKLSGGSYVERTLLKAIRNNIAIFAIHTNLDNVHTGVNRKICEKIGLQNLKVLQPKTNLLTKLVTFVPPDDVDKVLGAMHAAGAGQIGKYSNCSFRSEGTGSFKPDPDANPAIGTTNRQEFVKEIRLEVILPDHKQSAVLKALREAHPYEEVAFYLTSLKNENQEVGSGMVGELAEPLEPMEFLRRLKERMDLKVIRHTHLIDRPVKKIAICGGSGSFLLPQAIRSGAQVYISADFKYHEFFNADKQIIIADIGHYESEVFTSELLQEVLTKKFRTFAINFSNTITNPISYL